MSKRALPEIKNTPKKLRLAHPTFSEILGSSTAETQRTLPSSTCISNVLSTENQQVLNEKLLRVVNFTNNYSEAENIEVRKNIKKNKSQNNKLILNFKIRMKVE